MIGSTNRKDCLTFGDAGVPDTDSGSHHGIRDFRGFITIVNTVTSRFLR